MEQDKRNYKSYKFPIIIAYIIEGKELAMKVCDSIPILEMEELCKNDVERYLDDEKCIKIRQNLINILCEDSKN